MDIANVFGPDLLVPLILLVVVIFGANKLPKIARNIGEAGKEFKKAQQEAEDEERAKADAATAAAAKADDDKITLSKSELDALLAEREAKARREASPPVN